MKSDLLHAEKVRSAWGRLGDGEVDLYDIFRCEHKARALAPRWRPLPDFEPGRARASRLGAHRVGCSHVRVKVLGRIV